MAMAHHHHHQGGASGRLAARPTFNVDHALLPDSPLDSPTLVMGGVAGDVFPTAPPVDATAAAIKHHLTSDDGVSERKGPVFVCARGMVCSPLTLSVRTVGRGREDQRRFHSKHTFKVARAFQAARDAS